MTEPETTTEPTTATTGTPPKTEEAAAVTFSDAQQAEINRLIGKARVEGKTAAERSAQESKEAADAAKARTDQEAKGQYEAAKAALETERDTAATERDRLKTENDAIAAYFSGQYAAAMKDLPEVITAFAPADDASFAEKSAWLVKAQEQAAKAGHNATPGNRPNPKPSDGKRDLDAAAQQAQRSGRYVI